MRYAVVLVGLSTLTAFTLGPTRADEPRREPLVDQVRRAIEKGVSYLKQQQTNGAWKDKAVALNHPGGATCLALLALLNSGVRADDPAIKSGLEYIRRLDAPTTYVRSLQTMVYAEAGFSEDVASRVGWERRVIALSREPLLLSRSHDLAVHEQLGRAVVVVRRYPEDCLSHT